MATSNRIHLARQAASVALTLVVGALATACSQPKSAATSSAPPPVVRVWRVGQDKDALLDAISSFKQTSDTAVVTYSKKPIANYEQSALKSMASDKGPDVWSIPSDWIGDMEEVVRPLPDDFFWEDDQKSGPTALETAKEKLPAGIVEQITSTDGKSLLGLPANADTLLLYYNPELFNDARNEYKASLGEDPNEVLVDKANEILKRPPATWNDLLNQLPYLRKLNSDTSIARGAIALGTADNVANSTDILQLLMMQNGVRIVSSDRTRALFSQTIATPSGGQVRPGVKALEFYTDFSNPAKASYTWNASMPSTLDAFGKSRVAMVIAPASLSKALKVKYPKFQYEVSTVPQISLTQAPVNLVTFNLETVTKLAKSPLEAMLFMRSYATAGNAAGLASEAGNYSPYLQNINNPGSAFGEEAAAFQIKSGKSVFKKSRVEFDQTFKDMINDIVQNKLPYDITLDTASERINELLTPAT